MNQPENEKKNLIALITASVQKQLPTTAEVSISSEMLDKITAEVQSKLNEYINELRSEVSQCRVLLEDIVTTNLTADQDIKYIRELMQDIQLEINEIQ